MIAKNEKTSHQIDKLANKQTNYQGGYEVDPLSSSKRTPLYIARGKVDRVDSIGKVQPIINDDKSF